MKRKATERGSSLLEVAAAVALSAVVMSSALTTLTAAAVGFRHHEAVRTAMDLARSHLETAVALPCARPAPCPSPYRCRVEREVALLPSLDRQFWVIRLRATVTTAEDEATLGQGISLATLVARSAPCRSV